MDGQQLRRYVCPSRSTSPTKRSYELGDASVELDHLNSTKRHKSTRSVGTESTVQSIVTGPSLSGDTDDYGDGDYIHSSANPADERRELEEDLVLEGQRLPGLEVMPKS
jgi:hypothetical protein